MPSGYPQDLSGERFGRLMVRKKVRRNNRTYYNCICDCGEIKDIRADALSRGVTKSCGCLSKETVSQLAQIQNRTHGLSKTRLYSIWSKMIDRCENKKSNHYIHYGGRGITICGEWRKDFLSFYKWSYENGYTDDNYELSIDRIDVNGNYEPSNCRWADNITQANNKTNTMYVTINEITKPASEWNREYDLPYGTVQQRYRNGIRGRKLLEQPNHQEKQSGHRYITWYKKLKKWRFAPIINGKKKHMGYFKNLNDAIKAKEDFIHRSKLIKSSEVNA